jgi:DNA repair protein RadC
MTYQKKDLLRMLMAAENDEPTRKIETPEDAVPAFMRWARKRQEHFLVMTLDSAHNVIRVRSVTRGLLNRTMVHPREVFRPAISDNAARVIVAHNHPSGKLEPSHEDREITRRLVEAGRIIDIPVLDHIIVSKLGFHSFANKGEMP